MSCRNGISKKPGAPFWGLPVFPCAGWAGVGSLSAWPAGPLPGDILRPDTEIVGVAVNGAVGTEVPVIQLGAAAAYGSFGIIKPAFHNFDSLLFERSPGRFPPRASPQTSNTFSRLPNSAMIHSFLSRRGCLRRAIRPAECGRASGAWEREWDRPRTPECSFQRPAWFWAAPICPEAPGLPADRTAPWPG